MFCVCEFPIGVNWLIEHLQTQNMELTKSKQPIKTIFTKKNKKQTSTRNLPVKSPEYDVNVWNICSARVYKKIILKS